MQGISMWHCVPAVMCRAACCGGNEVRCPERTPHCWVVAPQRRGGWNTALTVAWYTGESNIHIRRELLSPTPVDNNRRVDIDAAVVKELDGGKGKDDRRGDNGHFMLRPSGVRLTTSRNVRLSCGYSQSAPVRVLTLTSSVVCVHSQNTTPRLA